MIALVDYGVGNLRSVEKALQATGAAVQVTSDPDEVLSAEKVILPGVGAFGDGMAGLEARGLATVLHEIAVRGTPLLGICLGMQLLFDSGEELGYHRGLGLLPGFVPRFNLEGLKIPHTGWNQVLPVLDSPLLTDLPPGSYAYFNHSYYCEPASPADTIAHCQYGITYASIVGRQNIYGVQFHPEKSQAVGLLILHNFVEHIQ